MASATTRGSFGAGWRRVGAFRLALPRWRARYGPTLVAYGPPSLVAAFAVQAWFREDGALASGDLSPPVTPGDEYRSHWNQFDTGAGAPSFQIVSFPFFEGLRLFAAFGLTETTFQRVWLTVLLVGATAAVVYCARGLVQWPLAAAVAGFVSLLNAYRLTTPFDSVPLVAMLTAGLLGGLVVRAGGKGGPRPLTFALASVTCGFVFLNPPHLILVLVWVVVCAFLAWAVHGERALGRLARFALTAAPLVLVLNAWWIVPAVLTITDATFDARFAAAAVDEWTWTHVRGDVRNVVGLTSSWVWDRPEYIPFSIRLEQAPFEALQYVPAVAATAALVLARGRQLRSALVLASAGVAAAVVMKGVHEPLGAANRWLYDQAPGFWLLRDPAKTGLVLVLSFALLAALATAALLQRSVLAARIAAVLVVGGCAVYAYPLLSGGVAPTERTLLPSVHVHVPDAWREAASYVDAQPGNGKVVVLPVLDYYQAPTSWGYYGSSFFSPLFRRPVLEAPLPGGYYRDRVVPQLLTEVETRLLEGRGVTPVMQALGARYIVLRRDLDVTFPRRFFASPDVLRSALARADGVRLLRSWGLADVYDTPGVGGPEVYAGMPVVDRIPGVAATQRSVDLPANAVTVRSPVAGLRNGEARVFRVAQSRSRVEVVLRGRRLRVQPVEGSRKRSSPRRQGAVVAVPPPPSLISVGRTSIFVPPGSRTGRWSVSAGALLTSGFLRARPILLQPRLARSVGDCYRVDARRLREVGISARVLATQAGPVLRLAAHEHAACVALPIPDLAPGRPFRLRLWYRGVSGNPPRFCVWQDGPDTCAPVPVLDEAEGWREVRADVRIATGTSSVRLFLYADGGHGEPTVTEYRGLSVARAAPAVTVASTPAIALPGVSYQRVSPHEFRVSVRDAESPFVLVAAETFASGWRIRASGRDGDAVDHFRANGYANAWRIPWTGSYELTLEYRPERLAQAARRMDYFAIPLALAFLFFGRRPDVRRRA
jgi:arabinofuranan 3-O-arabinosyltransferase